MDNEQEELSKYYFLMYSPEKDSFHRAPYVNMILDNIEMLSTKKKSDRDWIVLGASKSLDHLSKLQEKFNLILRPDPQDQSDD